MPPVIRTVRIPWIDFCAPILSDMMSIMRRTLATLAAASLVASGGFAFGRQSATDCPKGYVRGVTRATSGGGPGATLPNPKLWQYQMTSVCVRTVTLPVVSLVGGPYNGDKYFPEYQGELIFYTVATTTNNDTQGQGRASTADGSLSIEADGTQIAIRPRLSENPSAPRFGPASHYRLADGAFLRTDPAVG